MLTKLQARFDKFIMGSEFLWAQLILDPRSANYFNDRSHSEEEKEKKDEGKAHGLDRITRILSQVSIVFNSKFTFINVLYFSLLLLLFLPLPQNLMFTWSNLVLFHCQQIF